MAGSCSEDVEAPHAAHAAADRRPTLTQADWQREIETVVAAHRPWTVISAWCTATGMYCAALAGGATGKSSVLTLPPGPALTVETRAAEIVRQLTSV